VQDGFDLYLHGFIVTDDGKWTVVQQGMNGGRKQAYIRQAFQPILETPIMIRDSDRPIGTHVFTAMEHTHGDGDMRWSVVSMDGGHSDGGRVEPNGNARGHRDRDVEPTLTDPSGAIAALDRIAIPQDALDRISEMASPRSSLIISDEALSSETGKGTEFVILMSDEPQGGIKFRRRGLAAEVRYQRPRDRLPYWPLPFAGPFSLGSADLPLDLDSGQASLMMHPPSMRTCCGTADHLGYSPACEQPASWLRPAGERGRRC
jgi:hypothetical protein